MFFVVDLDEQLLFVRLDIHADDKQIPWSSEHTAHARLLDRKEKHSQHKLGFLADNWTISPDGNPILSALVLPRIAIRSSRLLSAQLCIQTFSSVKTPTSGESLRRPGNYSAHRPTFTARPLGSKYKVSSRSMVRFYLAPVLAQKAADQISRI